MIRKLSYLVMVACIFSGCTDASSGSLRNIFNDKGTQANEHGGAGEAGYDNFQEVEALPPDEYMDWVRNPDNGCKVTKKINELIYTAQYKPHEFEALLNLRKTNPTQAEVVKKITEIKDLQYFTFAVSVPETNGDILKYRLEDQNEYYARVEYYSFNVQNDFRLIDGTDTLSCAMCHFERTYSAAPVIRFVMAFPVTAKGKSASGCKSKVISYNDRVFDSGIINIEIPKETICSIPKLKMN